MCAAPIRDVRKPNLKFPAKAADCHAHVLGLQDRGRMRWAGCR